jgi:hypothetical protein
MAVIALTDFASHVGGYDFTTDTNNALLKMDADALPATPFRSSGWKRVVAGLKSMSFDMEGFWASAASQAVDPESFPDLGVIGRVYTVCAAEAQPASPISILGSTGVAYMWQGVKYSYQLLGQVGEVAPFSLSCAGSSGTGVVRGHLVKAKGTVSATGQLGSTYDNLGLGISASQSLFVTFHEFVVGTSITVQVQSDDNTGFSSPTTIGTIGPITTSSGTWLAIPGPITDQYLRLNVSAVTGTHTVAAAMAIRSTT